MAAIWLGAEKPHQGVSTKNQAWQPAPNVCNSTTALGLRAGWTGNRVRSFCSGEQYDQDLGLYYLRARYYNPSTGRFLSRDPEAGDPTDPQSLHKYLYAGGDPVNRIDPSGRADSIETIFTITVIATPTEVALSALAGQATAAIALLQAGAGQAYLTAQYVFELIAAAGEATGLSKVFVCGAVGLAVAQVESENKIPNPTKTAISWAFGYACTRLAPFPGPPPIKWF
jgi:RHS repeat-associated protein